MVEYELERNLLTHYQNLRKLAFNQLQAVEKGQSECLTAIIEQKQIIVNAIEGIDMDMNSVSPQTCKAVRKYILEILGLEEESQQKLGKIKNAIQKEVVMMRTENKLNEKYAAFAEQSHFVDESQ